MQSKLFPATAPHLCGQIVGSEHLGQAGLQLGVAVLVCGVSAVDRRQREGLRSLWLRCFAGLVHVVGHAFPAKPIRSRDQILKRLEDQNKQEKKRLEDLSGILTSCARCLDADQE
jgi:hypothetical protein